MHLAHSEALYTDMTNVHVVLQRALMTNDGMMIRLKYTFLLNSSRIYMYEYRDTESTGMKPE